jgi:hypothetical protein
MSAYDNVISKAIKELSSTGSVAGRKALMREVDGYSFSEWKTKMIAKTAGVGFITGVPGGPIGVGLEVLDIGYLLSMTGRACYGVGYIEGREVNYDTDISIILGIWSGAMSATSQVSSGKVAVKLAGKSAAKAAAPVIAKVAGKLVAKSVFKTGGKMAGKIAGITAAKLAAKLAAKTSTKWIPILGGVIGAGINSWVMDGLLDAARSFYRGEFAVFNDEIAEDLLNELDVL